MEGIEGHQRILKLLKLARVHSLDQIDHRRFLGRKFPQPHMLLWGAAPNRRARPPRLA